LNIQLGIHYLLSEDEMTLAISYYSPSKQGAFTIRVGDLEEAINQTCFQVVMLVTTVVVPEVISIVISGNSTKRVLDMITAKHGRIMQYQTVTGINAFGVEAEQSMESNAETALRFYERKTQPKVRILSFYTAETGKPHITLDILHERKIVTFTMQEALDLSRELCNHALRLGAMEQIGKHFTREEIEEILAAIKEVELV
jgi:hypothetical protein